MLDETTGTKAVLVVTTLDRAAYGAYDRAATALGRERAGARAARGGRARPGAL